MLAGRLTKPSFRAMILAAGLGERMRPLTEHTPKPLLKAGGKPLIEWQIARLRQAGFGELVINHAHLGHLIEAHFGDGSQFGVRIAWSPESIPLETAGGIANALALLGEAPFLVCNGDVYSEYDYACLHPMLTDMVSNRERLAHLVLVDNPPHHPLGDFRLTSASKVSSDETDPSPVLPRLTFSGIACYRPELFAGIRPGDKARLAPLLVEAMRSGRVTGEYFSGRWEDVGTPSRLQALDLELDAHAIS